ncbi:MAG: hypothetical protein ACXVB1_08940 [Pseudobdellovibrionaceae bacterium]
MADPKETQKVLAVFKEEGSAFGLIEYEIPTAILKKYGKVVDKTNPDIFAIFLNNATKKFRELFGI